MYLSDSLALEDRKHLRDICKGGDRSVYQCVQKQTQSTQTNSEILFYFLSPISNKIHYMQTVIILFLESTEKSVLAKQPLYIKTKCIDCIEKWPFMVIFLYNLYIFWIHLPTVLYPKSCKNKPCYNEVVVYKAFKKIFGCRVLKKPIYSLHFFLSFCIRETTFLASFLLSCTPNPFWKGICSKNLGANSFLLE